MTATGSLTNAKNNAIYSVHKSDAIYLDGTAHSGNAAAIAMFGDPYANRIINSGTMIGDLRLRFGDDT